MKKKPFITVETETTDTDDTETVTYDNVAVPEIHIKRKNK